MLKELEKELAVLADSRKAEHSYRFFKAFPGGYGEGDHFLGITVPSVRNLVRKFDKSVGPPNRHALDPALYSKR